MLNFFLNFHICILTEKSEMESMVWSSTPLRAVKTCTVYTPTQGKN